MLSAAALIGIALRSTEAGAITVAQSAIGFRDFSLTTTAGEVSLLGPWELRAYAEASNSLGEFDSEFASALSPARLEVDAAVTWAEAVTIVEADGPAPSFGIRGSANTGVVIPNDPYCLSAQALALSRGTWLNSFLLSGAPGVSDITLSAVILGILRVEFDECTKLAETEVIFSAEIDGVPVLHRRYALSNSTDPPFEDLLNASFQVQMNQVYGLVIEIDSESHAVTRAPIPGVVWILVPGLIFVLRPRGS
jgi:hypothetical protein